MFWKFSTFLFEWQPAVFFKALLPREARATNCTSQAGQDGIHLTALPLISQLSVANQTHHVAAFCFLTATGAKKVNSYSASLDTNTHTKKKYTKISQSDFICWKQDWTAASNHSPGHSSASSLSPGQPCSCFSFPLLSLLLTARPGLSSHFAYTTPH